ncbi:protein C19orf12 homolog isoform X5 [Anopheles cruzii]|nr:protein C19orf12 homolog isoform X5 [Anopheles cruzii]XP_052865014.1 protein C19orf12 homolog isoform X5 [Anopheles cruzii]
MAINTSQLLDAVGTLTDKQSMRVTLKGSTKGAIVAGSGTFLGGMLAGPIGLLIGGTLGGLAAYAMSNDFKPVSHIIKHELTVQEQERLKERILGALAEFGSRDLVVILPLLMGNASAQQAVLSTVISFLTKDMRMQIID